MQTYTVNDALALGWNLKTPVDLNLLASRLGIEVSSRPMKLTSSTVLILNGVKISTNANESLIAQRYALAHALGRLFTGGIKESETPCSFDVQSYRSPAKDLKDDVANKFALGILMPRDAIDICLSQGNHSITDLSQIFMVSEAAARIRLVQIGVLPNQQKLKR